MGRGWGIVSGVALALAALWSVGLMVLALVVPVYSGETSSATMAEDGTTTISKTTSTSATLVQVNGVYVLFLLAIPLVVTGLVALLLRYRAHRDAMIGAWVLTGLLGAFCVVGLMSIGLFIAPVALALVVACTTAMVAAVPVAGSPAALAAPNA